MQLLAELGHRLGSGVHDRGSPPGHRADGAALGEIVLRHVLLQQCSSTLFRVPSMPHGCRAAPPRARCATLTGMELPPGWSALLDEYSAHLRAERGLSPHTVRAYRTDLADLARFVDVEVGRVTLGAAAWLARPDDRRRGRDRHSAAPGGVRAGFLRLGAARGARGDESRRAAPGAEAAAAACRPCCPWAPWRRASSGRRRASAEEDVSARETGPRAGGGPLLQRPARLGGVRPVAARRRPGASIA